MSKRGSEKQELVLKLFCLLGALLVLFLPLYISLISPYILLGIAVFLSVLIVVVISTGSIDK